MDHLLGRVRTEVNDKIQVRYRTAQRASVRHTDERCAAPCDDAGYVPNDCRRTIDGHRRGSGFAKNDIQADTSLRNRWKKAWAELSKKAVWLAIVQGHVLLQQTCDRRHAERVRREVVRLTRRLEPTLQHPADVHADRRRGRELLHPAECRSNLGATQYWSVFTDSPPAGVLSALST